MKLEDVVAKVRASDDGTGKIWMRHGQVDLDYIVQRAIEVMGIGLADDGTILVPGSTAKAWEPPGGLVRPRKTYRNGRGVRK